MRKINLLLPLMILLPVIFGCSEKRTDETTRGRLKYVVKERMGSAGGHGYGRGWVTDSRQFYANGWKWSPDKEFNLQDFTGECEASPNEAVEAFRCHRFASGDGEVREITYVARMNGDQPEWATISNDSSIESGGENFGEWFDDGRQLIFTKFVYNVQTGERRDIKGVPDFPENSFRAASPDLKTVVFQGACFSSHDDSKYVSYIEFTEEVKKKRNRICSDEKRLEKNKLEALWLIDPETGATQFLELSREKYPWLVWRNVTADGTRSDWLQSFQKQLVWKKDETGKDQLVYPN